jgi:hypothetical protein
MFKCKACPCKESHIQSLKDEITSLRKLVIPAQSSSFELPIIQLEADAILSGNQESIKITEQDLQKEEFRIFNEASSILSGTYE